LAPGNCAVIEDAPAGVEAALRAGMTAIAVTGTAAPDRLARAHLVVDSLRELTPARISELIRHPDGK
ncbi:MAG TPA: HAD hydrolase-like protein, partial [Phycisphaerae bacterium]|nr:HAD hydrolase-like protein [Phycisphaerae bacterium]